MNHNILSVEIYCNLDILSGDSYSIWVLKRKQPEVDSIPHVSCVVETLKTYLSRWYHICSSLLLSNMVLMTVVARVADGLALAASMQENEEVRITITYVKELVKWVSADSTVVLGFCF